MVIRIPLQVRVHRQAIGQRHRRLSQMGEVPSVRGFAAHQQTWLERENSRRKRRRETGVNGN
ncbi:MAG: hypothetical protein CMJ75_18235 [Planctomycetaceae bacterium]|nr:hypothetical protein [Planctomycetaceae bacterium]